VRARFMSRARSGGSDMPARSVHLEPAGRSASPIRKAGSDTPTSRARWDIADRRSARRGAAGCVGGDRTVTSARGQTR
jgi:hypothetical protein